MAILKFTSLCEAPYENIFSFKEEGSDKQIMSTISIGKITFSHQFHQFPLELLIPVQVMIYNVH